MARVQLKLPEFEIGKVDAVFSVRTNENEILGDLKCSKGGIEWRPKHGRHQGGHTVIKLNWTKFAKVLEAE